MTTIADWKDHEFLNIKIDDLRLDTSTGLYINKLMTALKKKFDAVDAKLAKVEGAYVYRGTKATETALPATGNSVGDVWNVTENGHNYAWNGTAWDDLGGGVEDGGGLAFNEDGEMYVDFSNMPQDQINGILSSMNLPIFVDGTTVGTEFYVDGTNGIDKLEDDYGRSAAKPWATIAYATQTIAARYNINSKNVHINVSGGTYTNAIELPSLNATSGSVTIRPASESDTVTISNRLRYGTTINHIGGEWVLLDLNIVVVVANNDVANGRILNGIRCAASRLTIQHCNLSFVDENTGYTTSLYYLLVPTGGKMRIINNDGDTTARTATWSGTKGSKTSVAWFISTGGVFQLSIKNEPDIFEVSGAYTLFCRIQGGEYNTSGTGSPPTFNAVNSPTGKRYAISAGGKCVTGLSDPNDVATYFPGTTAGTVESGTYSFIAPTAS